MTDSNGTTSYTIEQNIPIPVKQRKLTRERKPRESKYPFRYMQVGDSFLVPGTTMRKIVTATNIGRKTIPGSKYRTCAEAGGVRVWRVA